MNSRICSQIFRGFRALKERRALAVSGVMRLFSL